MVKFLKKKYISNSENETQKIGINFANKLKSGEVVFLYGDLGFGKTTFVKGVALGLGISSRIISSTFTLVREHNIKNKKSKSKNTNQILKMFHIDLYRIERKEQLVEIGIQEVMDNTSSIKLVEWPEKIDIAPNWSVKFTMNTNDTRTINITKYG